MTTMRSTWFAAAVVTGVLVAQVVAQKPPATDTWTTGFGDLSRLSHAKSRSVSPENLTGAKGQGGMATSGTGAEAARDFGQGWKISPSVKIKPGETFVMGEIQGPGAIQHIWMTPTGTARFTIFRIYWDAEAEPSVETPVGDFFAAGWGGSYPRITSLPVCINPGSGLIASVAYWYQAEPHASFPKLPDKDSLEVR